MTSFLINPYRFGGVAYDTDAQAYITAVEAADAQSLEVGVKTAINAFVIGCKADGIWTAIKASCILAGARTLAGALVPLVGTAPTNVGPFVSGDYNRKTGLVGNGSTKYLNSNYAMSNALVSNNHLAWWTGSAPTINGEIAGVLTAVANGYVGCYRESGVAYYANWNSNNYAGPALASSTMGGVSRSISASFTARSNNTSAAITQAVVASPSPSLTPYIFCRNVNGSPAIYTNARLAFYSIGESLDLALLDARVSALISAYSAAIP